MSFKLEADGKVYESPEEGTVSDAIVAVVAGATVLLEKDDGAWINALHGGDNSWAIQYLNVGDGVPYDYDPPVTRDVVVGAFLAFYRGDAALKSLLPWKRQEIQPIDRGDERLLRADANAKALKNGEEFQKGADQFLIDQQAWSEKFTKELAAIEAVAKSLPSPAHPPFSATESIEGDGRRSGIAIDKRNNQIAVWVGMSREVVAFRDIVSSEVCIDGTAVVKSDFISLLGRAAIGGFLFSGVGAIVGGVTGAKTESRDVRRVDLKVLVKNARETIHPVCFYEKGVWGWATPGSAIKIAGRWHDLLTVAMKEAADHESASSSSSVASSPESLPTQLTKLAELHQAGAISEAEFKLAKQKLLG